jgi:hypothetical protein
MTAKPSQFSGSGHGGWSIQVGDWGYQPPREDPYDPALGPGDTVRMEAFVLEDPRYAETERLALDVWFHSTGGVIQIDQLTIRPSIAHAPGGLVTGDLRDIPLHEISLQALMYLRTGEPPDGWEGSRYKPLQPPKGWATNLAKRPGRAGRGDVHYARVATQYVGVLDQPKPLIALAKQLRLKPSQVRSMLYEARRRGLLTDPPVKGRAGGELTKKAHDILEAHDEGTSR